jgi:hypothetical protein
MNQVATTIEQSKEILKLGVSADTADMYWWSTNDKDYLYTGKCDDPNGIPAWSVYALMDLFPFRCNLHKYPDFGGDFVYRFEAYCIHSKTAYSNPFDAIISKMPILLDECKKQKTEEEFLRELNHLDYIHGI